MCRPGTVDYRSGFELQTRLGTALPLIMQLNFMRSAPRRGSA